MEWFEATNFEITRARALHRREFCNVKHWALHLEGPEIFQVTDDPIEFALDIQAGSNL